MAIQVQAKTTEARIQVKSIAFTSEKPILSLADILELSYDWNQAILLSDSFDVIDLSPYCNANSSEKLSRMGLDKKWFESERVVVDSIPFQVILNPPPTLFQRGVPKGGTPNLLSTNLNSVGEFTIPIHRKAGEIYLLLGAYYEGNEEPSIGRGKLTKVKHVERFVIEIEYVDGVKDFVFPARVGFDTQATQPFGDASQVQDRASSKGSDRYVIEAGVGVYRVVPTRMVDIKEIRIHDGMRQGEFYLAGLTIAKETHGVTKRNTEEEEPQAEESTLSIQREKEKIIQPEVPISVDEHIIKFDNGYLRSAINISDGLTLTSLENGYTDAACLNEPSPLFAIKLKDNWITSSDFRVTDVSIHGGTVANLSLENGEIGASFGEGIVHFHFISGGKKTAEGCR